MWIIFIAVFLVFMILTGRLIYLCVVRGEYYTQKATGLHERERSIKAARGRILDCNGEILADNTTVCTISVIHNQIEEPETVIRILSTELGMKEETVRKRVEKYSSMERIKSNVDKKTGDRIRGYDLAGVKVDEDYKRYYPYDNLASKVLGFTGGDNQGIIGLEVKYDEILSGTQGQILTMTDAKGLEVERAGERRKEPVDGRDLYLTLDIKIQSYATQLAQQAMASKNAEGVSIIVMNPKNGELLACVNVPEFNLNHPYELTNAETGAEEGAGITEEERSQSLNKMWRNACISDTYEPGSTFKIITATAGLEEKVIDLESEFYCPGYIVVDDRKIRCHKRTGHGAQDFTHCMMNSCNPVRMKLYYAQMYWKK